MRLHDFDTSRQCSFLIYFRFLFRLERMFSQRRPAKLQPYSKEPLGPPAGGQDAAVVSLPEPDAVSEGRTGNLEWCSCTNCTKMEREVDCFC